VVDETRVVRLLQRMGDQLAYLERRAGEDRDALRGDDQRLSGLKYRWVTTLEALLNVAHHLCASEAWGPPATNADAVATLARHGVIGVELADRLGRTVGFRNVLVHGYADVDDDRVLCNLDRLDDLRAFITEVTTWMTVHRRGEPDAPTGVE
jgi:uncharacterized protein YutE (UPF0331/DUF86 family)